MRYSSFTFILYISKKYHTFKNRYQKSNISKVFLVFITFSFFKLFDMFLHFSFCPYVTCFAFLQEYAFLGLNLRVTGDVAYRRCCLENSDAPDPERATTSKSYAFFEQFLFKFKGLL